MNTYIDDLVTRARRAQKQIEFATQEQVDLVAEMLCWRGVDEKFAMELSEFAVEESGMGDVPSKYAKMMNKVRGGWQDMKGQKSVGVIEENHEAGLVKIAKPVGVVGALVPCTNCEATPVLKAAWGIKTRNAVILAPHPRTKKTNAMVTDMMRGVLKELGMPEDLIISMDEVSVENSRALMSSCDLILATGGPAMVKSAYTSGTPAYGVGAGNAVTVVDESENLSDVAERIRRSKTFDQATSCSSENSAVVYEGIYDKFIEAMEEQGGYLCSAEEKQKLQEAMWPDGHTLNREVVAQSAQKIAAAAGLELPEGRSFLMVEESGIGAAYPFSGEKLSVVLALYRYSEFSDAIEMVNEITEYSGRGRGIRAGSTRAAGRRCLSWPSG